MTELELVPGTLQHAASLARTMAPADVDELEALGHTPLQGLCMSFSLSELTCTALEGADVAAMFGVAPVPLGATVLGRRVVHQLWFLTGEAFGRRPLASFRTARRVVRQLVEHYGELENAIDCRHSQALRFAQLMGAEFGSPVRVPPLGAPFVPFRLRA